MDEETRRWRNERKKNYPRMKKKEEEKKYDDDDDAHKRRARDLETILQQQRKLGHFETTALMKQEKGERENATSASAAAAAAEKSSPEKDGLEEEDRNRGKGENKRKRKTHPCKFWTGDGKCRKGNQCTFLHDEAQRGSKKRSNKERNTSDKRHKTSRDTLLRRIFKADIDRDNSRLLQAIRFFVENIDALRKRGAENDENENDYETKQQIYLKGLRMFPFIDDPLKCTKK